MATLDLDDIEVFVTDWDETATVKDTLGLLGEAVYVAKPEFYPPWNYYVDEYYKEYLAYSQNRSRKTLQDEIAYLCGLDPIEKNSALRAERSDLFKGVPESAILEQACRVQVRPGFWDVLRRLKVRGVPIIIVSVNWSATLIRQVLQQNGFADVPVYANDLEIKQGIATGRFSTESSPMRTANHKEQVIRVLRNQYPGKRLYYFGDSGTDLLAMMAADVGVVVHKKSHFDTVSKLGPRLEFVSEWTSLLGTMDRSRP
ncbi:hypothetical protein TRVA0_026S00518 [Trichomonascus vanleenenianus]|uniref:Cto1p n=1 Tax=Trichomonascus vanleenenianus TaxID=2268995 RepID=UPI003ECAE867